MTLIDFLLNNTEDIDLYVDGIDGIAVCPADELPKLTAKGVEKFKECFDLPVDGHLVEGTGEDYDRLADYQDDDEGDGGRLQLAWEFLCALAGYCSQKNFDIWFDEKGDITETFPNPKPESDSAQEYYALVRLSRDERNGIYDAITLIGIFDDIYKAKDAMKRQFDMARAEMIENENYPQGVLDMEISETLMEIYPEYRYDWRHEVFRILSSPLTV